MNLDYNTIEINDIPSPVTDTLKYISLDCHHVVLFRWGDSYTYRQSATNNRPVVVIFQFNKKLDFRSQEP